MIHGDSFFTIPLAYVSTLRWVIPRSIRAVRKRPIPKIDVRTTDVCVVASSGLKNVMVRMFRITLKESTITPSEMKRKSTRGLILLFIVMFDPILDFWKLIRISFGLSLVLQLAREPCFAFIDEGSAKSKIWSSSSLTICFTLLNASPALRVVSTAIKF